MSLSAPRRTSRPRTLAGRLERWFARSRRDLPWRRSYDPWQVWVSEVMLQQTRVEVVVPYFERFLDRFPTVASLAAAREQDVLALWSGLGYYRRARMLREGARWVTERGGEIPSDARLLREVPGIGRYTAGAIASIAFGLRESIVDGNVARVAARIETFEGTSGSASLSKDAWAWAERLVGEATSPRDLNQAMMELGATVCTPKRPACDACPVEPLCRARKSRDPEAWPRPRARRPSVELSIPLFVVTRRGGAILFRKESGTLLNAMLRLPHGSPELHDDRAAAIEPLERLGSFRHTITHRRIVFEVWRAAPSRPLPRASWLWLDPEELPEHPHPSYVRKAMRVVAAHAEAADSARRAAGRRATK